MSQQTRFERLVNSRFFPCVLSALVFPGAGQLVQRRWFLAFLYGGLFSGSAVWLAAVSCRDIYDYYRFALEFETAPEPRGTFLHVLLPLIACLLVWGANVLDVLLISLCRGTRGSVPDCARPGVIVRENRERLPPLP